MSKYLDLSIKEINNLLKNKTIKPLDLVEEAFERIENNIDLNFSYSVSILRHSPLS